MNIIPEETLLAVVDYQEKLMPVINNSEKIIRNAVKLIKGCQVMDIPVIVTQQYTKGIGETVSPIKDAMKDFSYIEKTSFSCWQEDLFADKIKSTGRKNIILCGVETHICVQQTALDLLTAGYTVYVIMDCISSRCEEDRKYGQKRMLRSGAVVTTTESVLFELCSDAKNSYFKSISKIIK